MSRAQRRVSSGPGRKALAGAVKSLRERGFAVRVKIGPGGTIGYAYAAKGLRKGGRTNNP